MRRDLKNIWCLLLGLLGGATFGFILANALTRGETFTPTPSTAANRNGKAESSVTVASEQEDEIRRAIKRADQSPDDLEFQTKLADALFRYWRGSGDITFLPDTERIVTRLHQKDSSDIESIKQLSTIALQKSTSSDKKRIEEVQAMLLDATRRAPGDSELRRLLGLSYYLLNPANQEAIREYTRAIELDRNNLAAIENLATAQISTGMLDQAERTIKRLEEADSANRALPKLKAHLDQSRNRAER
jgi:tetratricopeptide (TPR) repeat protein